MLGTASLPHDRAEDDRNLLSETVEQTVRSHLGGDKIVSVETRRDEDFDGEGIITVDVVINTAPSNFIPRSFSSLVRVLRVSLAEAGFSAFPMVRYMTLAERKNRRR